MSIDDIERLLVVAANDPTDPMARGRFAETLLSTEVLVPGIISGTIDGIAVAGSTARFAALTDGDGRPIQPFYTSEGALQDTLTAVQGFEQSYVRLNCREFFELTRGARLILNPHSSWGKEFLADEVAGLLDAGPWFRERALEQATDVLVGEPATVPGGLAEAVAAVLGRHSAVTRARLGWMVELASGDQSYLVVIEAATDVRLDVGSELGPIIVPFTMVTPVDVMYVRDDEANLLAEVEPFYEREAKRSRWRRR